MSTTAILKIGDLDITEFVSSGGIGWERNDIDSDKTTRMISGNMYRKRVTKKRKLSISLLRLTTEQLQKVITAIAPEFISVTYLEPEACAQVTKTFYGSSVSSTTWMTIDDITYWEGTKFNIVEK